MLDQRGTHADRAHEVGGYGVDQQLVVDPSRGFVRQHDAGIVEEDVEARIVPGKLGRRAIDAGRIGDVEFDRRHARIGGEDFVEMATPTARDDHLIVLLVERLGQSAADPGTAAGDEDGVAGEFHDMAPFG